LLFALIKPLGPPAGVRALGLFGVLRVEAPLLLAAPIRLVCRDSPPSYEHPFVTGERATKVGATSVPAAQAGRSATATMQSARPAA
jgi:hypothetical protein